jgi:hypothetical protein
MRCSAKEVIKEQTSARENGNDIETKPNQSFDNGVFFEIEAK